MESVNKHRKGIALFRDSHIFEIFETSVSLLDTISQKDISSLQMPFILAVLDLCLNTLLFDFIGSLSDETSEDNYTVQVPTIWRTAFTDGKLVDLVFQLYLKLPSVASEKILHIGVQLASVRRTLFNGSERQTYLEHVVAGVKKVIENPDKLTEQVSLSKTILAACLPRILQNGLTFKNEFPIVRTHQGSRLCSSYAAISAVHCGKPQNDGLISEQYIFPAYVLAANGNICAVSTKRELSAIMTTRNYSGNVSQDELQRVVVGLCRDLRGVAVACTTKNLFQILFDWLYPDVFNIMLRAVEEWSSYPQVMTPIFRLLAELCQNRQQRLKFEMSSCSAVLLFKEASKIICSYGNRILVMPDVPKERAYAERYKNIGIIFNVLKCALIGAYVPFGVFRLYGDPCLQDSLDMFVKLFMKIPEEDFHSYTKIAQHYYNLLENVVQDNIAFVSNLQPEVFAAILRSIHTGVTSLGEHFAVVVCRTAVEVQLQMLWS
ncbi:hypothetical protein OESDEN_11342 [Oesophagostomum dentatum]|uniref:Uncharacterized protein n=1 Tax=Oesophagostomum dentatum TaxID=61180 RepID=A0A0B1T096_OESDE|nr:hypothetical protein OESDEN_11342 [Oesophagostomum dentatum]